MVKRRKCFNVICVGHFETWTLVQIQGRRLRLSLTDAFQAERELASPPIIRANVQFYRHSQAKINWKRKAVSGKHHKSTTAIQSIRGFSSCHIAYQWFKVENYISWCQQNNEQNKQKTIWQGDFWERQNLWSSALTQSRLFEVRSGFNPMWPKEFFSSGMVSVQEVIKR